VKSEKVVRVSRGPRTVRQGLELGRRGDRSAAQVLTLGRPLEMATVMRWLASTPSAVQATTSTTVEPAGYLVTTLAIV